MRVVHDVGYERSRQNPARQAALRLQVRHDHAGKRCAHLLVSVLPLFAVVAISFTHTSAACNPPKSASTYNSSLGRAAYWFPPADYGTDVTTLVGRFWQPGSLSGSGSCNLAGNGWLYFYAGGIGLSMSLGEGCVVAGLALVLLLVVILVFVLEVV